MKFGEVDINPDLGLKDWKTFKLFFDRSIAGQVKETAEEIYQALGGNPPKAKKKEE